MDRACGELFARAGLAVEKHGGVRVGYPLNAGAEVFDLSAIADDRVFAGVECWCARCAAGQYRTFNRGHQFVCYHGNGDVILGALPHGHYCSFDGGVLCDHDAGQLAQY